MAPPYRKSAARANITVSPHPNGLIVEGVWGARSGGVRSLQTENRVETELPTRYGAAAGFLLPSPLLERCQHDFLRAEAQRRGRSRTRWPKARCPVASAAMPTRASPSPPARLASTLR